jgi:demethylmenaquinone methyltransferase / 2-methoxy-6-polyprenyl-1,4-benzoquinol methylase
MMAAKKPPALPGTRPQGARDEREAAVRVQAMFARIAPRYDFLNHLLSFSLDRLWRRRTARKFAHILRQPEARILDLCCGTGDLTFSLERLRSSPSAPVIGSDFVEGMLARAQEKARAANHSAVFAAADALHLPFGDASFHLITAAFGFRNLANYEEGLREFARVLKPGGELGILEFSEPASGRFAGLFRFYFRQILPRVGKTISGDAEAYAYLPGSINKFPSALELIALTENNGFADVRVDSWNFGTVLLHTARRT